jgi:sigma-B regulation protein RsbU (phosphoserine phosphatase)
MRLNSLRTKILLIVLAFIAINGTVFFIYAIITSINYKQLRFEGIEKTVEVETEKVNKIISELERGAIFYSIGGLLYYEGLPDELGQKFTEEGIKELPNADGAGFWFEPYAYRSGRLRAGFYVFKDADTGKIIEDETFDINNYDYHSMNWYREIISSIKQPYQIVWVRPYLDANPASGLMTTAGAGIFKDGKIIGITTVDWEIEEVIRELTGIKPTENSFFLLCDPKNDYVISSTRTQSVTGASINTLPWDITADKFELDGVKYFRFGRYIDNGWLLSVQIPENEIFAKMEKENRKFTVFVGFAAILMLLIAYTLITKFINNPLKRLTVEVSQFAIGNLDSQLNFSSKDELGQLANAFIKMKSELKNSIEENIREHAENERINTELNVATDIQASMLPNVFPPFPKRKEFSLFASMVPARYVGGDFYDFYLVDKDNLAVVIADVLGKGVPAALFMVITKTLIENSSHCKSPKKIFEIINKKLIKNNKAGMFVTAFMGFYNIPTGRFLFANAGHNPPLIKKGTGTFEFLNIEPCVVLAWMENAEYIEEEIILEKGDTLYLYTDGVTEAMNPQIELFGEQRLIDVLNKNKDASVRKLLGAVKNELELFRNKTEQTDDITMLALKIGEEDEIQTFDFDDSTKKLSVDAVPENLALVIKFLNGEMEKAAYSKDVINEIDIAAEEIFMNIANYAYKPGTGKADISINLSNKTVIKFEDTGGEYNPIEQADPDLNKSPSTREIGGLGIFMVKNMMDDIEYTRDGDKNILIITKNHP